MISFKKTFLFFGWLPSGAGFYNDIYKKQGKLYILLMAYKTIAKTNQNVAWNLLFIFKFILYFLLIFVAQY